MRPLAVLFVLLALHSAQCRIADIQIQRDDRALIPLSEAFGFGSGGRLEIELSRVDIFVKHDVLGKKNSSLFNFDNFGFFVTAADDELAFEKEIMESRCPLGDEEKLLFTFADPKVQQVLNGDAKEMKFTATLENGGMFYLYFANCEDNVPVSLKALVQMYNFNANGSKDFLSIGQTELTAMYWVSDATAQFSAPLGIALKCTEYPCNGGCQAPICVCEVKLMIASMWWMRRAEIELSVAAMQFGILTPMTLFGSFNPNFCDGAFEAPPSGCSLSIGSLQIKLKWLTSKALTLLTDAARPTLPADQTAVR